ncbi:MAG: aminoacetone oxidase family FAD-binding enzyme, partial [Deltaproteobacteria bacterium]|nr:aminoacetone oxidase family FAD-binding enzyme [Deltaproteobacteria bacterium]
MAAGRAAACGASVTLLEKMPRLGLKLGITGKGRCNVTNIGTINDYVANFSPDGRFLINALNRFFHHDLTGFLDAWGVPTVVERGQRVFPASNRALDVVSALLRFTKKHGVFIIKDCAVKHIRMENNRLVGLDTSRGYFAADRVILATGGASYPQTGSTGDGFRVAQELGHTIAPIRPYLVPLLIKEPYVKELQG